MPLRIQPFDPAYADALTALVVGIQRDEFGFPVGPEDQPDLVDVPGHYGAGGSGFWLALDGERLLGSIGLLDLGAGHGSLRKMFVVPEARGRGAAAALLEVLLARARDRRFRELWLGTTSRFHAAHRFYEKNGFERVDVGALPPGFPVFPVEDRFYRLDLR